MIIELHKNSVDNGFVEIYDSIEEVAYNLFSDECRGLTTYAYNDVTGDEKFFLDFIAPRMRQGSIEKLWFDDITIFLIVK